MITLENNVLEFRFPDVHEQARCSIEFQRTLRIPDDGNDYPLPPGLGRFPLRHLDDYSARLPEAWRSRGGVLLPIHQAEALWVNFRGQFDYPFAVKVATGEICALTGDASVDHLNRDPQDYVVLPDQPWLDGYCVEKGVIRQFVAMPLGKGYTVEEQLTGAGTHGGLQITAYPMKRERYEQLCRERPRISLHMFVESPAPEAMGLAPGGRMKQEIYDDPHSLDVWDQRQGSRCFVSVVNSAQWMALTGEHPPSTPPTAQEYADAGLPWFDYYGGDVAVLAGARKFEDLTSLANLAEKKATPLADNDTVVPRPVLELGVQRIREVREGSPRRM